MKVNMLRGLVVGTLTWLTVVSATGQTARIQVIHNSADIDARIVDIYANDVLLLDDFAFRNATPFTDVPVGAFNIKVTPGNMAPADSIIAEVDVTLEAGVSYVAIINGISNINLDKYANPEPGIRDIAFTVFAIDTVRETAQDPSKVEFFAFHGVTDGLAVDILVDGTMPPLVDNLDYGQWSPYVALDPAVYVFSLTEADDNTAIVDSFAVDLSGLAGASAVVFGSGFVDPVKNQGGQKLGLLAALANGEVIEFPSLTRGPIGPWQYAGLSEYEFVDFLGADTLVAGGHGVVVDKFNRIWIGNFGDVLRVINPDGSSAPFSPIVEITVGDTTIATGACRGMAVAKDGNILYAKGAALIKVNVETGEGMSLWIGEKSLTKPAVDSEGFIYAGYVVGITPINVIDPATFELTQQIELVGAPGFGRGIEVTADGTTIWTSDLGESGGPLYKWTTTDFVTYTKTDSIFTDTQGELILKTQRITMDWGPDSTLWVSVDNAYDQTDNSRNVLAIFNFETMEYKYLFMPEIAPGVGNGPRGVAFSATGDTAYAICWNGNRLFRFVKRAVTVADRGALSVPKAYELGQNYPNPFNPFTTIPFTLSTKGFVVLKVYNTLGREVATLVEKPMLEGHHRVVLDGSDLASGIYYYRLKVDDGAVLSKRMVLIK